MTDTLGDRIRARRALVQQYASDAQTAAQSYTDNAMDTLRTAIEQYANVGTKKRRKTSKVGDGASDPATIANAIASSVASQVADALAQANAYTDAAVSKLVADNSLQS